MSNHLLDGKHRIHMIGIGGSGMFPLAQILHAKGYSLSGSDCNESDILKMVRNLNIPVLMPQKAENIQGADLIVYSAAIAKDNPERVAAEQSGIPTIERSVLLGELTRQYSDCICVSGTHGKTTTTSILTQILIDADADPTAVIGGKLKSTGNYGCVGTSQIMSCEACEFVDTFLHLFPDIAVVLNIDCDHLDYFHTMENMKNSFEKFCNKASRLVLYNGDDDNTREVVSRLTDKETVSFGFSSNNDYYPADIKHLSGLHTSFVLMHHGEKIANLDCFVPGEHNILNATAACAAALAVGIPPEKLSVGLSNFRGAGRRFEMIGEKNGVTIVDDYAHHPTEIAATLNAAKKLSFSKIWALHQPFTYSRTKMLLSEFAEALSIADEVVLTDIMGGREKNTYEISAEDLAAITPNCHHCPTQQEAADYILAHAQPGDLVLTLGCGDIYKAAKMIVFGNYQ